MPDRLTATPWGPILRTVVVSVVLLVLAGAVAGVVWVWLWTPPSGVVVDHRWVQDETGLLMAVLLAVLFDRTEIATLIAVLAGSVLAGWVMYRVGLALSPADPRTLADSVKNGTRLPGRLAVDGGSPFRAFPGGAMLGLVIVYFGLSRRRDKRP